MMHLELGRKEVEQLLNWYEAAENDGATDVLDHALYTKIKEQFWAYCCQRKDGSR